MTSPITPERAATLAYLDQYRHVWMAAQPVAPRVTSHDVMADAAPKRTPKWLARILRKEDARAARIRGLGLLYDRPKLAARFIRDGVTIADAAARMEAAHQRAAELEAQRGWDCAIAGMPGQ